MVQQTTTMFAAEFCDELGNQTFATNFGIVSFGGANWLGP
jgi:hypothetical protein